MTSAARAKACSEAYKKADDRHREDRVARHVRVVDERIDGVGAGMVRGPDRRHDHSNHDGESENAV